jgi:hypothetical protein
MMRALVPVQPSWGMAPNRGQHTAGPDDPTERRRGLRVPSISKSAGQGKGTGTAPTPLSVEGPKVMPAVVRVPWKASYHCS